MSVGATATLVPLHEIAVEWDPDDRLRDEPDVPEYEIHWMTSNGLRR
jgi:hypothetical protein